MPNTVSNTGDGKTSTTNPLKFQGEPTFEGIHRMTSDALKDKYDNIHSHNEFGSTNVELPSGQTINVKDMMYYLGHGKVGMHLIPVNDNGNVVDNLGNSLPGYQLVDDLLRQKMRLDSNEPIYALIAYIHPELHSGKLDVLAESMLKTEMGNTHLGAYLGEGKTSNSPEEYHGRQWQVEGYPANVQIVSLQGVSQSVLNKNAHLVDAVLNSGVAFPGDYKNDKFRTIDLNTCLFFYKEWLLKDPANHNILRTDESWATYCAEHKAIIVNIMLNVPHNEASFKEVFAEEGERLWRVFKKEFERFTGRAFTTNDETDFEPLWKKEGLFSEDSPQTVSKCIRAWKNITEYEAYDQARHAGTLSNYQGFKPLLPGQGMAWPPETTADLVKDFADAYTSLRNVGGALCAASIAGFMPEVSGRMGITSENYFKLTIPIMTKVMMADAKMNAANESNWFDTKFATLYIAMGGNREDIATGQFNAEIKGLIDAVMLPVKSVLSEIIAAPSLNIDQAELWLEDELAVDLQQARATAVTNPEKTQFYSPPATTHRVSMKLHEASPFVKVRTVATAVDSSEVESQVGEAGYATHTVVSGDSLFKIARQYYGSASGWDRIYEANRDILDNPNLLRVGMVLRIPQF